MAASNNCKRKANISADDAISEILRWVENDNEEDEISLENDLFDLYGEVDDENIDPTVECESDHGIIDESDDDIAIEGPVRRKHQRKRLTYQRLVHSIDSALDEINYDAFELPFEERTITGTLPDENNSKNKVPITFSNRKPNLAGRQRSSDVIRNRPGLAPYASSVKMEEDAFSIFFTDELFAVITTLSGKTSSGKIFVGDNFRHLKKISSFFPTKILPDSKEQLLLLFIYFSFHTFTA